MSFAITSPRDIVKPLQYVSENSHGTPTNFGVTPTASPAFTAAGINVELSLDPQIVLEHIRAIGAYDIADSIKTQEIYGFTMKSNMLNTTLAKIGFVDINAAGTVADSLSFAFSKYINGTEYYTLMKGCKPVSSTVSVSRGLWSLDMTWLCSDIIEEDNTSNAGLTTPTWVSAIPTGTPLKHNDNATPFAWNSVAFPERSFSMTAEWDYSRLESNGQLLLQYADPAVRRLRFDAEVFKKSDAIRDDYLAGTERAMTYAISSETITLTNATIESLSESYTGGSADAAVERISGTAQDLAWA